MSARIGWGRPGQILQSTVDARWAEQQLSEHHARRAINQQITHVAPLSTPWDTNPDRPPPALMGPGVDTDRPPSVTRREARYRDGYGPPPTPPPPPISEREIALVLQAAGLDPGDPRSIDRYAERVKSGALPTLDEARVMLGLGQARRRRTLAGSLRPQSELDGSRLGSPGTPTRPQPAPLPTPTLAQPTLALPLHPPAQPTLAQPTAPAYAPQLQLLQPEVRYLETVVSGAGGGLPAFSPHLDDRQPSPTNSGGAFVMAQSGALSPSQKRRLRRKRLREQREGEPLVPGDLLGALEETPALQVETPGTNGYHPIQPHPAIQPQPMAPMAPPIPSAPPLPRSCGHEIFVWLAYAENPGLSGGGWVKLVCEQTILPHSNQAHLMRIPEDAMHGAVEVFVGWFEPGE